MFAVVYTWRKNLESKSVDRIIGRNWNPTTPQWKDTQSYKNKIIGTTEYKPHTQFSLHWSYRQHPISEYLELLRIDIYNWDKQIFPTFMLALLLLYFCWVISVIKVRTATMEYQLIMKTRGFKNTRLTDNDCRQQSQNFRLFIIC